MSATAIVQDQTQTTIKKKIAFDVGYIYILYAKMSGLPKAPASAFTYTANIITA